MSFDIYLSPPHMTGDENRFIEDAFARNWIAPLGPNVDAFEVETSAYVGNGRASLALCSGTAAIHLALIELGVTAGDTVICSSLTFSASANPIRYCGAQPVFVDSDAETWNMSPVALEVALADLKKQGRVPKAAIIVNLYGQSADYDMLLPICERYGVPVVEDSAESLGATYRGRQTGTFGAFSVFSFNGNKIITTSGGGMLLSNDVGKLNHARFLSTQARDPAKHYQHSQIGYNYRLSNILAGVGRGQLTAIENRVASRRLVFERYRSALGDLPGVGFMPEADFGRANRWLTVMTLEPQQTTVRPLDIVDKLQANRIEARPVWKPLHQQPVFSDCAYYRAGDVSISDRLYETGVCLPSGSALTQDQQARICELIRGLL